MTEQPDGPNGSAAPEAENDLHPNYVPAEEDSKVLIGFVGNTAVVGSARFRKVDAFQLLALGDYLIMKGRQMIATQEAIQARQEAAKRIVTPSGMADGEAFVNPDALRRG